jgi:hypothetical protein
MDSEANKITTNNFFTAFHTKSQPDRRSKANPAARVYNRISPFTLRSYA